VSSIYLFFFIPIPPVMKVYWQCRSSFIKTNTTLITNSTGCSRMQTLMEGETYSYSNHGKTKKWIVGTWNTRTLHHFRSS